MNALNDMCFGRTPCFFAISLLRSFMAVMCGAASSRARAYVIAPVISQVFISSSAALCCIPTVYQTATHKARIFMIKV